VAHHADPGHSFWQSRSLNETLSQSCAAFLITKAEEEKYFGPTPLWQATQSRSHCADEGVSFLAATVSSHGSIVFAPSVDPVESDRPVVDLAESLLLRYVARKDVAIDSAPVLLRPEGGAAWSEENTWPATTSPLTWYLRPDGALGELSTAAPSGAESASFSYDPENTDPCSGQSYPEAVQFWVSAAAGIELVGSPVVNMTVSTTATDTEFFVTLYAMPPAANWEKVAYGGSRLSLRNGPPAAGVLPGEEVALTVEMTPVLRHFEAGTTLLLSVMSSNCWSAEHPNLGPSEWASAGVALSAVNTVHTGPADPSTLVLPTRSQ